MKVSEFKIYSRKHIHFYSEDLSPLLTLGMASINTAIQKPRMADLGCGDGRLIFALHERKLLEDFAEIVGVDISRDRIKRLKRELPFVKGIVSDALNACELSDSSFDFVVCSQVIEHVDDDEGLISEIRRLLRDNGLAYLSTVVRKRYAGYFYTNNGSFKLDPTHVREYSSDDAFVDLVQKERFEIVDVMTHQVMYPIIDLVVRLLLKAGLMEPHVRFYSQHKILREVRKLRVPIYGYSRVEVLARKVE